jgi:hypothetical protein
MKSTQSLKGENWEIQPNFHDKMEWKGSAGVALVIQYLYVALNQRRRLGQVRIL